MKYKVLVIDDDYHSLVSTSSYLAKSGYEVTKDTNPENAISLVKTFKPDFIILDWYMNGMDGIEVLKRLKEDDQTKAIPAMIISGIKITSEDLKIAFEAGAIDYIRKPIDYIEFSARLNSMLTLVKSYQDNRKNLELLYEKEKEVILEREKNLKHILDMKNKELATNALRLVRNYNLVSELQQDIQEFARHIDSKNSQELISIVSKYNESHENNEWEEFEVCFRDVHPNFYLNLAKQFPGLTQRELRLAALFKMNMTSKEIASLTYSTYEGIKKAKTRLKKSLKLDSDVDLSTFLNSFE